MKIIYLSGSDYLKKEDKCSIGMEQYDSPVVSKKLSDKGIQNFYHKRDKAIYILRDK